MKIDKHIKIVSSGVLLGVVGLTAVLGTSWYVFKQTRELARVSGEVDDLVQQERGVVGLRSLLNTTSALRNSFDTFTIKRSQIVGYLEMLESIMRDAGLTVDVRTVTTNGSLDPGTSIGETLSVELEIRGQFAEVMEAIYRVESLPVVAYLDALRLEYVDGGVWAAYMRILSSGYINDEQ